TRRSRARSRAPGRARPAVHRQTFWLNSDRPLKTRTCPRSLRRFKPVPPPLKRSADPPSRGARRRAGSKGLSQSPLRGYPWRFDRTIARALHPAAHTRRFPAPIRRVYVLLPLLYTGLACVVTYPLVWHLSSAMPHDVGDPLLSTTLLWWNAHTTPLTARWWDGLWYWPAPGSVAFSDHRLGESLMATPLQWFGLNAVTAANLTLLAMFPLSALAAHWLGFTVTRRHDAAILCGLAYGFCPYRIAHLQHLELLGGFGMPAALAALHRYRDSSEWRWLVVFFSAL